MNLKNKNELEMQDITQNTEIKLENVISKDTTQKWTKNCPKCGREQMYCCKSIWKKMLEKNTLCNRCRGNGDRKYKTENLEKLCPKCNSIMKYGSYLVYRRSVDGKWLCRKCSTKESAKFIDRSFQKTNEYREKMSNSLRITRKECDSYNTESHREKLRVAKINQIRKLGTQHTYNSHACEFIDEYGKKSGYNFQHALNGGEIIISGYCLDGYDKEKNIVFEYDEPKHNAPSVKKNDRVREQRIIEKIKPVMFIRYDEENKVLYDVVSGKELM